jgi:8-oxo-dGTP diphosphatase
MRVPHVRVVACVARRGNRLLVCRRPAHKRHGGLWEFPGGKCEPGESDAAAAEREMMEELGVTVRSTGKPELAVQDDGSPYLIVFVPVEFSGEPVCSEHDAMLWATPEDLLRYPLAPSDRVFAEFLARTQHKADT